MGKQASAAAILPASRPTLNYMKINAIFFGTGLDVFARKRLYVLTMNSSTTHQEASMKKVIGTITTCDSDEHPYLRGYQVKIVAVIKNSADLDADPDEEDNYITDNEDLQRAGGVTANDRVEVQPFLDKEGRYSFVSSDPKAEDLACFSNIANKGATR